MDRESSCRSLSWALWGFLGWFGPAGQIDSSFLLRAHTWTMRQAEERHQLSGPQSTVVLTQLPVTTECRARQFLSSSEHLSSRPQSSLRNQDHTLIFQVGILGKELATTG